MINKEQSSIGDLSNKRSKHDKVTLDLAKCQNNH